MGWSLTHHPLEEPELLDEFFLIIGKALYLASTFESKCRWVLRIVRLAQHFKETADASATEVLAMAIKDKLLGATIADMKGFPDFSLNDIAILERAKEARNFIAHESASIGRPLSSVSAKDICEQLERLRGEVASLTAGDNLVSRWVFEIQEKEPAPRGIQKDYQRMVQHWVFGSIDRG